MKKIIVITLILVGCFAICGCEGRGITSIETVNTNDQLPEVYYIKCIRVDTTMSIDRVYILCKDGKPVQGLSANEPYGKSRKNVGSWVE